jgi:CO/xanthine dehydrogenase FAD-binding subunit
LHAFDYAAPATVKEAVALLGRHGKTARILAGGTDIITQMKEGRRRVNVLVDVKKIPEANEISYGPRKGLRIGAAVPCARIYDDPAVSASYPALIDAVSLVGSIQIQSRATLAGNLCNASPAADTVPAMVVLGAQARVVGPRGERLVPVEAFCMAPGQTVLKEDELVLSLDFPAPRTRSGAHFLRFIPRNEMDIAVANAAAQVVLDKGGSSVISARIAVGAVAPTVLLLDGAADALMMNGLSDEAIDQAAGIARDTARPITDMRGTEAQRVHLAGVLTRRAIKGAVARAQAS